MISPRKFRRLPYPTRLRKTYRIVLELQRSLRHGETPGKNILELLQAAAELGQEDAEAQVASTRLDALAASLTTALARGFASEFAHGLAPEPETTTKGNTTNLHRELEWHCEHAAAALEALCGIAPADWDLLPPVHSSAPGAPPSTPPEPGRLAEITVYLEDLRSPFNIGSIVRSAAAFGCRQLCLSPHCADEQHPRSLRAAMGALCMVEIMRLPLARLQERQPGATLVALETGGTPVAEFEFPQHGILVLGNEELGIASSTLSVPDVRRVSIPSYGDKATLNVGVAAGIALSWWRA